jgi:general secretion pathway protein C
VKATTEQIVIGSLQRGLTLALLVYAGWLAAHLTWHFLQPQEPKLLVAGSTGTASRDARSHREYPFAQMNLFGRESAPVAELPRQAVEEVQKTTLRLRLVGVFTAEEGPGSGAIVEEIGKSAEYYRVGAVLPGNATLESVHPDRIMLRRAGRLEVLSFDEEKAASGQVASQVAPKRTGNRTQPVTQPQIETPEAFIKEATRQLAEDPDKALGSVGLVPSEDGGYVYRGDNPMLSGMNLKQGDVIRSVNGHLLGDIKKDRTLMQTLYDQGNLEVEVVRDGTSFFVNYPLR